MSDITIRRIDTLDDHQIAQLAEMLVAVVEQGASVGYVPPLPIEEAADYWRAVPGREVALLIVEADGKIIGTGHLEFSFRLNGLHRAEVCKVIVHPDYQRRGIAKQLMQALEDQARALGRSLLYLDTDEDFHANKLYLGMGYIKGGRIPNWALGKDGLLHGTVFYYKILD